MGKSKKILVAPLNWGLGHAARCIPIINKLIEDGYEVLLASDGRALELLKKEFPKLPVLELPGYNISYTTSNMFFNIAYQLPKILMAYFKERSAIKKIAKAENIDIIISDNRFGCLTSKTKNIFITHQLNIIVPFRPLEWLVNKINHLFINMFDECWVPDSEGDKSLAGKLSEQKKLKSVKYIGPLSRMQKKHVKKVYDIIVVLSGPEPQRSHFEKALIDQLKQMPQKSLIVQGKTDVQKQFFIDDNIEVVSYLTTNELNQKILASDLVIARSGYSTIMDLVALGKKAILIPTPGQTEQEYLANRLHDMGWFLCQKQNRIKLFSAIEEIKRLKGPSMLQEVDYLDISF